MIDAGLIFATNQRPTILPSAGITPALLPQNLAPNWLDFGRVLDWARGRPVYANFRVAAAFDAVVGNTLSFCVFIDDNPTFINVLSNPQLVLARGHDIYSSGLSAGAIGNVVSLALPPLSPYALVGGEGRRYMCLGMLVYVPTTDWATGGLDAWLSDTPHVQRPVFSPSGF